ncbi:hypothetical protein KFK09_022312 [Dendrobium nobile]|uniref:Uncharacterized protein n=1 Tax=Dendrobium nobile TaxID=94219 RepID=A0A8T3APF9_DENNO|nr:hypothetical protein KFK09_022312 [Dendrobium nobile]
MNPHFIFIDVKLISTKERLVCAGYFGKLLVMLVEFGLLILHFNHYALNLSTRVINCIFYPLLRIHKKIQKIFSLSSIDATSYHLCNILISTFIFPNFTA